MANARMSLESTTSEKFLRTIESWFSSQREVLVLIRHSHAAGNKGFEFYRSFSALHKRLLHLQPKTCVTVFRKRQLPLRGVVDDEFVEKCLSTIADGAEYAVVETVPTNMGRLSFFGFTAGESHYELRQDLESSRGKPVAVGEYPPWQEESSDVISAYTPGEDGAVRRGVY